MKRKEPLIVQNFQVDITAERMSRGEIIQIQWESSLVTKVSHLTSNEQRFCRLPFVSPTKTMPTILLNILIYNKLSPMIIIQSQSRLHLDYAVQHHACSSREEQLAKLSPFLNSKIQSQSKGKAQTFTKIGGTPGIIILLK